MDIEAIIANLEALADPANVAGMARWIAADAIRELTDEKSWYRWQKPDRTGKGAPVSTDRTKAS